MTFTVIDAQNEEQMKRSMFVGPKAQVDLEMLRSSAATKKINATFRKNRYNINVAVVIPKITSTGVHNEFDKMVKQRLGDKFFDPEAIRIIYNNNVTATNNHIPMTAWILAHRIGHMTMLHKSITSVGVWKAIHESMKPLFGDGLQYEVPDREYDWGMETPLFHLMPYLLTMRSARMGKLNISPDFFAEMLAQHIITGKVTFLRKEHWEERIMLLADQHPNYAPPYRGDHPSAKARIIRALNTMTNREVHSYLSRAEHLVNQAMVEFMVSCKGKTLVF